MCLDFLFVPCPVSLFPTESIMETGAHQSTFPGPHPGPTGRGLTWRTLRPTSQYQVRQQAPRAQNRDQLQPPPRTQDNRGPRRRRGTRREKEPEPPYSTGAADAKRDRKRKNPTGAPASDIKRKDEDTMYIDRTPTTGQPSFRTNVYPTRGGIPEPVGLVARRSDPSTAIFVPPKRYEDYDYDEGVAEVLMDLASYRTHATSSQPLPPPAPGSSGRVSPHPMNSHRGSISSNRGDRDPPAFSTRSNRKRLLSPMSEDNASGDLKRAKVDGPKLSPASKQTPTPSTRPSPIPFRTQPKSSSPEVRQLEASHYRQASPSPLFVDLPPHPRPIGNGMALPPIATISPTSSVSSGRDQDRMAVDRPRSTTPPPSRAKISEVIYRPNKSPTPDREHVH